MKFIILCTLFFAFASAQQVSRPGFGECISTRLEDISETLTNSIKTCLNNDPAFESISESINAFEEEVTQFQSEIDACNNDIRCLLRQFQQLGKLIASGNKLFGEIQQAAINMSSETRQCILSQWREALNQLSTLVQCFARN